LPGDYNSEHEKQVLPPSSLGNLQTAPELASEALIPPHPASGALPPVHPSQNFLPQRQAYQNQELSNLPVQDQVILQHDQNGGNVQEGLHAYVTKQGSQRHDGKRLKGQPSSGLSQSSLIGSVNNEEEEVRIMKFSRSLLSFRHTIYQVLLTNSYVHLCDGIVRLNRIRACIKYASYINRVKPELSTAKP